MSSGGFEKIIPLAAGVIVFIMMLGVCLSAQSFQRTDNSIDVDHNDNVPNPASMAGSGYFSWTPITGSNITPHGPKVSDYYWSNYGLNQKNENNKTTFTDPLHTSHKIDVRYICNNSDFDASSTNPEFYLYDFLAFDGYDSGISLLIPWYLRYSMTEIANNQVTDTNYSMLPLGVIYNISVLVKTPGTSADFRYYIWNNQFSVYIVQAPQVNYNDFLSILWWILTFNNAWMPSSPLIAAVVSGMVDAAIGLVAIRLAQGFIP